jgi:hypothetical protein
MPCGSNDAAGCFPNPLAPYFGSIVAVLAACRARRLALVRDKSPFRVASLLEMHLHHVGQVLVVDLVQLSPEHSHYCHFQSRYAHILPHVTSIDRPQKHPCSPEP